MTYKNNQIYSSANEIKVGIVSTFSDNGYYEYGKYFVDSIRKFISKDIMIHLYVDNIQIEKDNNLKIFNLEESSYNLVKFKERNKNKTVKDWRWDGVRFAHKTFAIFHAVNTMNVDYLIWLDSDTELYNEINSDYLIKFLPKGNFVGYIGRDGISETGFLIFDIHHPHAKDFFQRFEQYYNDDLIYTIDQQHDAFVFDTVRKELESSKLITSFNISPFNVKKNHFNVIFNGYMIHYKGDEKLQRESKISKILRRKNNGLQ